MNNYLIENPLLLLFVVAAIGYLIGSIRVKGSSLGVAAVLFVGLAFGMLSPDFNVHPIIFQIGLIFFVYSIGLSSGPAFFQSFKKNGWRDIGYVMVMLLCTLLIAVSTHFIFGFGNATITGLYSGSSTNTTALAAIIDLINNTSTGNNSEEIQKVVVGYTYSYPIGVIGVMAVIKIMESVFKIDYNKEKELLQKEYPIDAKLTSKSVLITNPEFDNVKLRDFKNNINYNILFGRINKKGNVNLTNYDTIINVGDEIMIIGGETDIEGTIKLIGEEMEDTFHHNRKTYDIRRIFVSNQDVVGKTISSLNLSEKFDAIITRIRRGDIDLLAQGDTVLELGDRIRFIARRSDLDKLSEYFGDSYYASSRVNLFSFGLGIALGLLLGLVNFTLPGGINFTLGYAGGPLIVGLILGALRRTGPIVWTLPYGANVTLQQIGLILLLAVVGLKSGNSFLQTLGQIEGLSIFLAGIYITIFSSFISILIGYKLFKIPYTLLLGFMSNQPAILDFGQDLAKNKIPTLGYTLMFPIAMIMKILYAQILYIILA
jgi:putative transport protein